MTMGFGSFTPTVYFKIKDGKIFVHRKDGTEEVHDNFTGIIDSIDFKESEIEYNGKKTRVKQWNVAFDVSGKRYIWSTKWDGILFQSFINSIASIDDFSKPVQLSPYTKDGRTKLWITVDGEPSKWKYSIDEMPKIVPLMLEGEPVLDSQGNQMYSTKARMEWTHKIVEQLNAKIRSNYASMSEDVYADDVVEEVAF